MESGGENGMKHLGDLVAGLPLSIPLTESQAARPITAIAYDSRRVLPGTLFVCIEGYATDGHRFIPQALAQGAAAILVSRPDAVPDSVEGANGADTAAFLRTDDTRTALAHVSDRFFGHPSGDLSLIGVTGTKGKTTTTYMIRSVLKAAGRKTGLIGTIANIIGDEEVYASRTTPESPDLQSLLSDMVRAGMDTCVMEVSSQGLMLRRVHGCEFDIGIYTNLYHDHIGPREHASMEEYLEMKSRLFGMSRTALVNLDAAGADRILGAVTGLLVTLSLEREADVRAFDLRQEVRDGRIGTAFQVRSPWMDGAFFVGMPGRFNVYNALAALACGALSGIGAGEIRDGLAGVTVRGRVQPIATDGTYQVVVDYAHNAASLENLLSTLREYVKGRLITVFGCGGDRARSRRFEMGAVSGRLSDLTILTSDNPRTEDPAAILADIVTGITPTGGRFLAEIDRKTAIHQAVRMAEPGDMVVVAGKGHENYQIFADRTIHFDDAEVAAEAVAIREAGGRPWNPSA